MEMMRPILVCVAAALVALTLKSTRPEIAAVIVMAAGLLALMMLTGALSTVVEALKMLGETAGIGGNSSAILLRACGISLVCDLAGSICLDAGEAQLAQRIALGGRVILLSMSAPLIVELLGGISEWLR